MIATGITTRTAENEDNDSAVMNYSQCTLNDGNNVTAGCSKGVDRGI